MTPTDKVLLEGRGFALSLDPWESHTPKGFFIGPPLSAEMPSFLEEQGVSNFSLEAGAHLSDRVDRDRICLLNSPHNFF
jgi:hypothetical protein